MPKYYIWSGKRKMVAAEEYPLTAAAVLCAVYDWEGLGKFVKVSQVGFNQKSGHPDHKHDCKFTVAFLKNLVE
jgi:hypothetical protein